MQVKIGVLVTSKANYLTYLIFECYPDGSLAGVEWDKDIVKVIEPWEIDEVFELPSNVKPIFFQRVKKMLDSFYAKDLK